LNNPLQKINLQNQIRLAVMGEISKYSEEVLNPLEQLRIQFLAMRKLVEQGRSLMEHEILVRKWLSKKTQQIPQKIEKKTQSKSFITAVLKNSLKFWRNK